MDCIRFPLAIEEKIKGKTYRREKIGRSGAEIFIYEDMVLKIEKSGESADREYEILRWLEGKLPSPHVLVFVRENGFNYLLMTKIAGTMACDASLDPQNTVKGLARGLKMLWRVDISDCPVLWDADTKLMLAEKKLADSAEKKALFHELKAKKPSETLVFSHGDYCLPNVFLRDAECVGFLDLGSAGIADLWYDIMMCRWSLSYNFRELGGMDKARYAEYEALFFEELGLLPDEEKMRYYEKLDEFFI